MNSLRNLRPGARRKLWRLSAGLVASVALHATVLGAIGPAMHVRKDTIKTTVVYARVLPIQAVSVAASAELPTLNAPADAAGTAPSAPLPASPGVLPLEASTVSAVAGLPAIDPPFDRSEYRAADTLAQRPAPLEDLTVDYPATADAAGSVKVRLTVYIDEAGRVVRVEPDAAEVPAAFVTAATAAFLNANFSPGVAADGTVKTRLHIEVAFELKDRSGSVG